MSEEQTGTRGEGPHEIIWRLEKECIALRERAERAEAKLRRRSEDPRMTPPEQTPETRADQGVGCHCGWPLDSCNPKFAKGHPCGKEKHEARYALPDRPAQPEVDDVERVDVGLVPQATGTQANCDPPPDVFDAKQQSEGRDSGCTDDEALVDVLVNYDGLEWTGPMWLQRDAQAAWPRVVARLQAAEEALERADEFSEAFDRSSRVDATDDDQVAAYRAQQAFVLARVRSRTSEGEG